MNEIKKIGNLCPLDAHGYIINQADFTYIDNKFRKVIELINENCLSALPGEVHSIYLRGSVPRGAEVEGVSDVDVIVVTYSDPENLDLEWTEVATRIIDEKYSFINGVELGFSSLREVKEYKYCSMIPFILKTYGVCVYGENLISELPGYKPDRSLANEHLFHLPALIDRARRELEGNEDTEDIEDCCSWIMRIIVRAGVALVIIQEEAYTRDLYPAYELFSKHYPEKEKEMRTALWYAINPSSDSREIKKFLDCFGNWIEEETENWLDIYNKERKIHLPLA
ncbi:nucleotidyltransferase domain-containing protein [Salimicrobium jeotgali]|uniref:nucleotidyltransferase domain-containing protein n=1 Tax=Salimicrobium jeotgali TaxID=1230341 RepID=UPI000C85434F|nr:nucleotidyltransferase domain-containing protein [Salimicrobium jeotgali]